MIFCSSFLSRTLLLSLAGGFFNGAFAVDRVDGFPPSWDREPPRIRALLEKAWVTEQGSKTIASKSLALAFYCEAAQNGSAEGHFRSALVLLKSNELAHVLAEAKTFWMQAIDLGHIEAEITFAGSGLDPELPFRQHTCLSDPEVYRQTASFDDEKYFSKLGPVRREIAGLIFRLAPEYQVDERFALAIASTESNFDPIARSPKNAQGVMQLIPETAARFNVKNILDPEQNVRGGLAYLRWLLGFFAGDFEKVAAAYNAGEGAVLKYGGVPPYLETRAYVWRVLRAMGRSVGYSANSK